MKIPRTILERFEEATEKIDYGSVTLEFHKKGGAAPRFVLKREDSFLSDKENSLEGRDDA